jgi:gluconate 2-dehydrogenase gamma chain
VVDFIDLQLAGGYGRGEHLYMDGPHPQGTPEQGYQSPLRPAELWREGLAAMQTVIGPLEGQPQSALDQLMTDLSEDRPALAGRVGAKTFFTELHALTNQGYFADPIYGGNKGYAGWHMVGFPGAFGYFTDTVDAHNRPYRQPPMGIGHQPGTSDFNWER